MIKKKYYRIRKLTPREIGRLMGVKEEDIDIMTNCGISHTQLCNMYGNSIVVNCMSNMFEKLFIHKPKQQDDVLW